MKALTLALMFSCMMLTPVFGVTTSMTTSITSSITITTPTASVRQPYSRMAKHSRGGRWYFAATGHAVYCYGPVMTVPTANGDLQRVATFCRDGGAVVPLKD